MSLPVTLVPGNLGPNPCYLDEQSRYNAYTAATQASLPPGYTTIITSTTAPGPDDRDKIWCQVDGAGRIVGFFTFTNGSWQTINPTTPYLVPGEFREYDPSLYTPVAPWFPCDGTQTGVPNRKGTSPVCSGQRTLPSGSTDTATNYVAGTTGGSELVYLLGSQNGPHSHLLGDNSTVGSGMPGSGATTTDLTTQGLHTAVSPVPNSDGSSATVGHANVPPFFVASIMQWRPDLV